MQFIPPPPPPVVVVLPPPPPVLLPPAPRPLLAPVPRFVPIPAPRPAPPPAPRIVAPPPPPVDPVEAALAAERTFLEKVSAVPVDMREQLEKPPGFKWTGRSSRTKGANGEREVIDMLQPIVDVVRNRLKLEPVILQRNLMQAHLGGCDIHGLDGFAFEIKRHEQEQLNQWWRQAVEQGIKQKAVPILLWRGNGGRVLWKAMVRGAVVIPTRDKTHLSLDCDFVLAIDAFLVWFEGAYAETVRCREFKLPVPPPSA
jgi:hypothetical protein